ncbi:hypothetical protein ABT369_50045 [Dactylosporangium sp. NPDC000244]|uniref:hypothetical protein n=1 Tax=Dactylosporangium sp. NPDC000244 TaxID=3154365 RepID=UPI003325F42C
MPITARHKTLTMARHKVFTVQDGDLPYDETAEDALRRAAATSVVAADAHRVCVAAAQTLTKIAVNVEVWDGSPAVPPGTWDAVHEATFDCPSGTVVVDNTTSGPIEFGPGGTSRIAVPPGAIHATVYVAGHEDTADAAMEALTAPDDDRATRLAEGARGRHGAERQDRDHPAGAG